MKSKQEERETRKNSDGTAEDLEAGMDEEKSNGSSRSKGWRRMDMMGQSGARSSLRNLPTSMCRCPWKLWSSICENKFILGVSVFIFCVLLGAGIAITIVLADAHLQERQEQALDLAVETGERFSDELHQAILPLFTMAQFAVELPLFRTLPQRIGAAGEEGSLPFVPPKEPGAAFTHRNITGVCDDPALVERFNGIASSIKKRAKMEGVLVNLQLAPEAVVCLLYPLVNTEDFEDGIVMDNTGARGLDLLTDPVSSFIAKATIPTDAVSIAGPLTLRQCRDSSCDATVEKAFIARLPIAIPDNQIYVDGTPYPRWGFATALINWEALVIRSAIYESFAAREMEFQLTRTDRKFNIDTDSYDVAVVVLAETPNFLDKEHDHKRVTTALQTTNNEWEITVIYDVRGTEKKRALLIMSCIIFAICIAALVYVILAQRQSRAEMVAQGLAQQQASVETERNMTAYFAHELRNPLGAIDSALSAMPDDLPESAKDLVAGMQLCTDFMSSIMNNLLDVRKMEENKMILLSKPMSLKHLVTSVHKMLLPSAKQGVAFRTVVSTTGRDWVLSDLHRIQQVMTNVITNAIKYTVTGSISLCIGWENNMVKFECIDTGPGIPKDQQELMFERFVQRGGAPGSGLGLAISKHIVILMGGSIHFESDPTIKPGTSCVVLLPLPVCEQPTIASICPEDLQPLQEALSFLVVDDIRMNRMMLERRIKRGIAPNCTIAEAATGEEALAMCENERFDVIVVDQYMKEAGGVMLGIDVVREMRRMEIDSIIIGSSGNEMDVPFREAGTDWVWQKPIPPNLDIIQRLRGALAEK